MVWSLDRGIALRRAAAKGILVIGLGALGTGILISNASAQDDAAPAPAPAPQQIQPKSTKPAQAPAAAPAPAAAGAPAAGAAGEQADASWVKLCEKSAQTENKEICLTHHERLDGNTGMVLVAAAVRTVEGDDKKQLLVRLPTAIALAIPAGVQIRVDEGEPVALKYTLCYGTSCQAETELTKELYDSLRNGKQLVVAAVNLQKKAIGFPVPLLGLAKAFDGPPIDNAKYQEARKQLMEMIRKRQIELANKAAEAEKNKGPGGQPAAGGQAQAGAGEPTIAPKPPAQKKPAPAPAPLAAPE
jgi:invasion protein IalB